MHEDLTELEDGVEGSRQMDHWFMMSSPWPVIILTLLYLCFVLRLGPRLMNSKPPYNLKTLILLYNCLQVGFSTWFVLKVLVNHYGNLFQSACYPKNLNLQTLQEMDSLSWYYLMSKFVELLDTVFFVLRRKMNQITFLHVYHHTNMAVSTWAFLKYVWGCQIIVIGLCNTLFIYLCIVTTCWLPLLENTIFTADIIVSGCQIIVIGLCNTFVHILMYSYYLLAAMGPRVRKCLWWKKYITCIQIIQFFFIIGFLLLLLNHQDCEVPRGYIYFAIANTTSFLALFLCFFINSYIKKLNEKTK